MTNLNYNGQIIEQRISDNYVNLTQMAKANGVEVRKFNESEFAKKYLKALQESICPESGLMVTQGFGVEKATWGHPLVAIAFGQWISPEFHVWCNMNIQTLMTQGYVSLPQQPKLPANKVALEISRDIREITDNLTDNPRLAQFLIDHAISEIMPSGNTLTGAKLKGVAEIAEEMGFSVNLNNRSQLGKFVKARCGNLAQQEERLVNGQIRAVACYPENSDEVRQAITDFFVK